MPCPEGVYDLSFYCLQIRMRGKAARALLRYTKTAMQDLQHDEDEMLRGQLSQSERALNSEDCCIPFALCDTTMVKLGIAILCIAETCQATAVPCTGVDWGAVESFVDLKDELNDFVQIDKDERGDPLPK